MRQYVQGQQFLEFIMDPSVFSSWARGHTIWATPYFPGAGILTLRKRFQSRLAYNGRYDFEKLVQ